MAQRLPSALVFVSALVVGAPGCAPDYAPDGADPTSTVESAIRNGTRSPTTLSLASWEQAAIGWLHAPGHPTRSWCTVSLVAPRVALTAAHCVRDRSLVAAGFGLSAAAPTISFSTKRIAVHPTGDVALLILDEPATVALPGLTPLGLVKGSDGVTLGGLIEIGGVGETGDSAETGEASQTRRRFASLDIVELDEEILVVDGKGVRGLCFGDSGAPALVVGLGGRPLVAAIESGGERSCVDRDWMTRVGPLRAWIQAEADVWLDEPVEGFPVDMAEEPVEPAPVRDAAGATDGSASVECVGLSYQGACDDERAVWCEDGERVVRDCGAEGSRCGFVDAEIGYYCLPADTCEALPAGGRCEGSAALRCELGQYFVLNCDQVGATCGVVEGRAVCAVGIEPPGPVAPPAPPPPVDGNAANGGGCSQAQADKRTPGLPGSTWPLAAGLLFLLGRTFRRRTTHQQE